MADLEIGLQAFQTRDYSAAIAHLEKACEGNPAEYKAYMYLGAAYGEVNRTAEAIAALTKSVEIEPTNPQARYNLATAMERAGYREQAIQVYEQALMLQAGYPAAAEAIHRLRAAVAPAPAFVPPAQPVQQPYAGSMVGQPPPTLYAPQPAQPPSLNASPGSYGARPLPPAPLPVRTVPRRGEAAERPGGGSAFGVILLILLAVCGGFGGWYWWMHRTNPKDQALAVYKALITQDYKSAYPLLKLNDTLAKQYPDSAAFEADCRKANDAASRALPMIKMLEENVKSGAHTAKVGEPVVTGDRADVPTSMQISFFGQTLSFAGKAHMVNDSGLWKLDMSRAHTPEEIWRTSQELVGKPNMTRFSLPKRK